MDDFTQVKVVTLRNGRKVPVALGFDARGPVFMVGAASASGARLEPEACDHEGFSSSRDFHLRCGRCGAPMRLHRLLIARKSLADIAEMERAWKLAGEPEWMLEREGAGLRLVWAVPSEWVRVDHPLFAEFGGLPVRPAPMARDDDDE